MKGVMIPAVSAGSNHAGARETWTAQVNWPSGAAATEVKAHSVRSRMANRTRRIMGCPPLRRGLGRNERTVKVRGLSGKAGDCQSRARPPMTRSARSNRMPAGSGGGSLGALRDEAPARRGPGDRLLGHAAFLPELLEMRVDGHTGRHVELRGNLRVDRLDHVGDGARAVAEGGQDLPLALETMVDVLLDLGRGIVDHRPVGRIDPLGAEGLHAAQRVHVVAQITVLIGDDAGGATQDEIAGEEGALLFEEVAQVVRGVAGRVNGPEPDAIAFDDLSVLQVRGPLGQPRVLEDQLGDGEAGETLAEMRHAAQ